MNEKTNSSILGKYNLNTNSILKSKHSQVIFNSLKPIEPKGQVVTLTPKYVPSKRKTPKCLIGKPKEPKFVPYEPYKGAVIPIIPRKQILRREVVKKPTKNNVDVIDLVTQISDVRVAELNKGKLEALENDEPLISRKQWESEVKAFETDIKNLRETNAHLENQVKFQTQVNGELKTLLVAAVGEDLESRVQHLTEDKLQLARALLNSANHLTSHQEQTEWLSGQCEVWRSKFLASSLMVEELARWKTGLNNKINELQENVRCLIEERKQIRTSLLQSHNNLTSCNLYLANEVPSLHSTNILELSAVNRDLSCNLKRSLIRGDSVLCKSEIDENSLEKTTPGEREALMSLNNPVVMINKPDLLCNALVGAAMSVGGGQMFLQHPAFKATCCAHCKGEMEDI